MQGLKNPELFKQACYINGKWVAAESEDTLSVRNPVDDTELGKVPNGGQEEAMHAIYAANAAWKAWRQLTAKERASILLAWADLIDENKEDLARIMTLEEGKPLAESRGEMEYANGFIRWYAEEARRVYGDVILSNKPQQRLLVIKQPVGVVAAITPWNFPSAMITRKVAPALAVGCTVVVKPDSKTPFSALALAVLAEKAGMPAGVLNIVTGQAADIGQEFTSNPLVRKLSFTGSTAVGRLLMAQCATSIKKISLELGGNAPFIVFEDADINSAVQGAMASKFRNAGQTCVCANRFYIHEKIYDKFAEKFVAAVKQLKIGNGLEQGIQVGPLISKAALEKVEAHINDGIDHGAQIRCGGKPHALGGLFFEPTVMTHVNASMRFAREETFGPVAPLFRFSSEQEVIQMANDTEYGLASYFYSQDVSRIWRIAEALEYGMVGINAGIISTEVAPFGGVKQSGIGREGSMYGLEPYLEIKYVCMELAGDPGTL
ncbi:MAG: succinate-semialdehyde dehydrogenase (NADP(+)) [Gammaproteobacteria bacterium RIFCSPHIGHO2_12_FULL_45_12]|nr:MAG: succinate-semialdehyde dehydrogenase (NADP(+)) [Gammaproteobacteria bacterium RIFCSPHIGHO2_12_FULL_45_12]